ncbi:MAG: hypothetical protein AAFQ19_13830 [Pseudomonadota bacterium]
MADKLILKAYADPELDIEVGTFEAQINPEGLSEDFANAFVTDDGIETGGKRLQYKSQEPRTVSFTLYLDGTGVVPGTSSVSEAITKFEEVTYAFNGEPHSPNFLLLIWGGFIFPSRLTNLSISHELFSPSGDSLRAKLDVTLREHRTAKQIVERAGKKSDDLSKVRRVVDGMTLPMMCQQVYGDAALTVALARANDLDDLMHLTPGQVLAFPPVTE